MHTTALSRAPFLFLPPPQQVAAGPAAGSRTPVATPGQRPRVAPCWPRTYSHDGASPAPGPPRLRSRWWAPASRFPRTPLLALGPREPWRVGAGRWGEWLGQGPGASSSSPVFGSLDSAPGRAPLSQLQSLPRGGLGRDQGPLRTRSPEDCGPSGSAIYSFWVLGVQG